MEEEKTRAATTRDSDKYIVRFPEGMRERLHEAARQNSRTLNAEIVARLQTSLLWDVVSFPAELQDEIRKEAAKAGRSIQDEVLQRILRAASLETENESLTRRAENIRVTLNEAVLRQRDLENELATKLQQKDRLVEDMVGQMQRVSAQMNDQYLSLKSALSDARVQIAARDDEIRALRANARRPGKEWLEAQATAAATQAELLSMRGDVLALRIQGLVARLQAIEHEMVLMKLAAKTEEDFARIDAKAREHEDVRAAFPSLEREMETVRRDREHQLKQLAGARALLKEYERRPEGLEPSGPRALSSKSAAPDVAERAGFEPVSAAEAATLTGSDSPAQVLSPDSSDSTTPSGEISQLRPHTMEIELTDEQLALIERVAKERGLDIEVVMHQFAMEAATELFQKQADAEAAASRKPARKKGSR